MPEETITNKKCCDHTKKSKKVLQLHLTIHIFASEVRTTGFPITNNCFVMDFYHEYSKFYVAVDCIIFGFDGDGLKLLLIKRDFEPKKGELSLMGGFMGEDETGEEAARRVLFSLTGLENVYLRQVGAFSAIDRDPGGRVVSLAYYALIDIRHHDEELLRRNNAFWVGIDEVPRLSFDHNEMVGQALKLLRRDSSDRPIAFNLLPKEFTLPQFQHLYESLYGETLDKRNFRKKVAEMEFIEKTGEKDKSTSKRGAALYRFNQKKYDKVRKFKI